MVGLTAVSLDLSNALTIFCVAATVALIDTANAALPLVQAMPALITGAAAALALISLGGGFYEIAVVDPAWPKQPSLVQPARGGLSRKRFWIPAHIGFELALLAALFAYWGHTDVRFWLLVAFASHAAMRIWSAFDFIPKALAFERADPGAISESTARRWATRSRLRLLLDLITCGAMLAAFAAAVRL